MPSFFVFSMVEPADRVVRELDASANWRLDEVDKGIDKIEGLWTSLEKSECPVSPLRSLLSPPRP